MLSFKAVIVGNLLAYSIIIPGMNEVLGGTPLELNFIENTRLIYFVFGIFTLVEIGSGVYSVWCIFSLSPLEIFGGKNS